MISRLLAQTTIYPLGLAVIRVVAGGIICSYSWEMFNNEIMSGYQTWLTDVKVPFPQIMAYVGKMGELIGGVGLLLGLFTRLAVLPLIATMIVINFVMLDGALRSEPFYLLLLFAVFFFVGGGKYSIDQLLVERQEGE